MGQRAPQLPARLESEGEFHAHREHDAVVQMTDVHQSPQAGAYEPQAGHPLYHGGSGTPPVSDHDAPEAAYHYKVKEGGEIFRPFTFDIE